VFVDRFNRKRILLASDLLRGLIVLAIPISVQNWGLPALYVLIFMAATVRQFFDPAWESVLPEVASEEELAGANSFLSISSFGSTAIGFAAAGLLAGINIYIPFYVDALTFAVSFLLILFVKIKANASTDATSVGVVLSNLKEGARTLWRIPILRSLFIACLPVFLAFGLWNTLLLPMAIKALDATEFEYGIQEGLTSVGFVVSALLMAKLYDRIPDGQWLVSSIFLMGVFGVLYGLAPNIQVAIVLVTITGFLNSPSSIARRTLLQRNTPREMRGRVFSAFFVSRDVVFLIGMAGAGLADFLDVRMLIVACSLILVGAGVLHQVLPGIGRPAADWRRALQLLRTAPTAESLAAGRAATMMDLDRLIGVLPELGALAISKRVEFLQGATVRKAAHGTAIVKVGEASDSAFFVVAGRAVAGIPDEGGEVRSLSAMGPGDFFGEIAAITGSPRTANVVADEPTELLEVPAATLRSLRDDPEMNRLINSKLTERLTRTANADLVRLAGLDQRDLRDLRRPRAQVVAQGPAETDSA
jgi:CRP-like cAMP-binding protein